MFSRDSLPPSLQRVYDLTGQGKTNQQIADEMGITYRTAKQYHHALQVRSGMNRYELIADYQYLRAILAKERS